MSNEETNTITASELRTYLYSLEQAKVQEIAKEIHEYRQNCTINGSKPRKREIAKIEKTIKKNYVEILKNRDEIVNLLEECKEIPIDIEKLQITEYMLYRVDLRKAEKIINKATKKQGKRFHDIQKQIIDLIEDFTGLNSVGAIDYNEFRTDGTKLANSKEQYKLEYTEEQRNALIEKELDMVEKAQNFNSIPIPHEILKNSDRDIQSKMQRFNAIRQKRIRLLSSMKEDYQRLIEPREILGTIDDALSNLDTVQNILTKTEYRAVKNTLIRRRKKIFRSTNDIRAVISAKEKKTGLETFNIQQARYLRMESLRNTIAEATNLIKENPVTEFEEQLGKLKIAYEREKQFASVIEKLDNRNLSEDPLV